MEQADPESFRPAIVGRYVYPMRSQVYWKLAFRMGMLRLQARGKGVPAARLTTELPVLPLQISASTSLAS